MDDGLLQLLSDVITVLQNLKDQNGKPVFRKVTIYNSQDLRFGSQNDYNKDTRVGNIADVNDWPACFIEPVIDNVNTEGLGTQTLEGRLLVHICTYRLDFDTNWQQPYVLRTLVHQALQMLKDEDDRYASLMRRTEVPDVNHDTLYNWIATYGFLVVDDTANIYRDGTWGTAGLGSIIFEDQTGNVIKTI
ncbi:MAG: hypothetical protein JSS79_05295 [Bacteroidetes bacterium]|nr:hypothetical protein [Bacteroidota bacterium]